MDEPEIWAFKSVVHPPQDCVLYSSGGHYIIVTTISFIVSTFYRVLKFEVNVGCVFSSSFFIENFNKF